jgi:hypothetical protein
LYQGELGRQTVSVAQLPIFDMMHEIVFDIISDVLEKKGSFVSWSLPCHLLFKSTRTATVFHFPDLHPLASVTGWHTNDRYIFDWAKQVLDEAVLDVSDRVKLGFLLLKGICFLKNTAEDMLLDCVRDCTRTIVNEVNELSRLAQAFSSKLCVTAVLEVSVEEKEAPSLVC